MDNPFYYGEEVGAPYFTNRKEEISSLVKDLARGQNVIVYSPRRYGKTSLIKQVLSVLKARGVLTFYINLYAATSKKKFIDIYARAIASGTKGKLAQIVSRLKELFPRMLPKIIVKGDGIPEFEFDYNRGPKELSPVLEDLYEAVEKYAIKEKKRAVLVFDEFQEILNLEDDEIERSMRGAIQAHKKTAYVFMGSRRHMMQKIFNDAERPFYKSGRMFPLEKIGFKEFSAYLKDRIKAGGIKVNQPEIDEILSISECHPYYTQMLASVLWDRNLEGGVITQAGIKYAVDELISRESYTYTTIWDGITTKRKLLLEALALGGSEKIYSKEFISNFDLGNPSQIQKTIKYFEEKGLLYRENGTLLFSDIFFKQWILKRIV